MKNLFIGTSPNIEKDDMWLVLKLLLSPWTWKRADQVAKFESEVEKYLQLTADLPTSRPPSSLKLRSTGRQASSGQQLKVTGQWSQVNGLKAFAFDSARTSLYELLKTWGIGPGDEVIVPSFTCVVVINPILALGAKPVYVDTDPNTFNANIEEVNKKILRRAQDDKKKVKAILVQHTFGVEMDVARVREIVGPEVKIVEDLAHSLHRGAGRYLEAGISDGLILTFGIEKMMTSLRGGMVVVASSKKHLASSGEKMSNNKINKFQTSSKAEDSKLKTYNVQRKTENVVTFLAEAQRKSNTFSYFRIWKWLINPVLWAVATPTYFWGFGKFTVGKVISEVGHKIGIMGNMMEECEYKGCFPAWMPSSMPGALAQIGRNQLKKLDKFNTHRQKIAKIYDEELGLARTKAENYYPLRYPILVDDPSVLKGELKKKNVVIGNWYEKILFTDPKYLRDLRLEIGDIPATVEITKHVVNLPTFIKVSEEDAREIAQIARGHLLESSRTMS